MTLKKFIMLLKDPDPCKECLVMPICSTNCDKKNRWEAKSNSFFIAFYIPVGFGVIASAILCMGVTSILFYFGLVDAEVVKRFDPFPQDMDYMDDYYY